MFLLSCHEGNYVVAVDSFLIRFRQFYFLTQSDDFAKAIAFAWRPFLLILKLPDFSSIGCFSQRVFA